MLYVKATVTGIVSGLLLAIAWFYAALWLPLYMDMFLSYVRNEGGYIGASSVGSGPSC
jgi:hypothetical protein